MHTATIHLTEPVDGHTKAYFASLDGEHYIGVHRLPESEGDWDDVRRIIEGSDTFKPMTWAPRGIRMLARENGDTVEWETVTVSKR